MSIKTQEVKQLNIDSIDVGGDIQGRIGLDSATVDEDKEAMQNGASACEAIASCGYAAIALTTFPSCPGQCH
jgi:methionine aminopeptidase